MKKSLVLLLSALPGFAFAANTECQINKYDIYIDASIAWYQDLADLASAQDSNLTEVSEWFVDGRTKHFELSRAAVHQFLETEPNKVSTEQDVESWLQLSQQDIKELGQRDDELGALAKSSFEYRQKKPHPQNYEFRSALAELLSTPGTIKPALGKYHDALSNIAALNCQ